MNVLDAKFSGRPESPGQGIQGAGAQRIWYSTSSGPIPPTTAASAETRLDELHALVAQQEMLLSRVPCAQRRPGFDELTGAPQPGAAVSDLPGAFMQCRRPVGHGGDHADALGRAWSA